jgi:hypothetical protein
MSVLDNLKRKSEIVRECLRAPGGKALLKVMHEEFDRPDLRGATVEETYYNLGRRDALIYLEQLRDAEIG